MVAIPTETVYGLAARIDSESAVGEIFSTKQRPFFDPLIVHVHSIDQAKKLSRDWNQVAEALARKFWPGPLTLVLPKSDLVSGLITSGLDSVGLRCPDHPLALQLIRKVGIALAAPSANLFGRTSPTSAEHVETEFASKVPVLDGGHSQVGIESTVVLIRGNSELSILREGQILQSQLEHELRQAGITHSWSTQVSRVESPGHLKHHYMPSVPLIYCRQIPRCEEHLRSAIETGLKTAPNEVEGIVLRRPKSLRRFIELSLSRDPRLAARELYQKLRELSVQNADVIYFVEPEAFRKGPETEQWQAIRDRLSKAATLQLDEELA